jgi:hypothetical protein
MNNCHVIDFLQNVDLIADNGDPDGLTEQVTWATSLLFPVSKTLCFSSNYLESG